jgi:hypothetical protein
MEGVLTWVLIAVLVVVVVAAARILLAARRAKPSDAAGGRRRDRRPVEHPFEVPERTPIAERLDPVQAARLARCESCGNEHPFGAALRSGDSMLLECPGCGRRTQHRLA